MVNRIKQPEGYIGISEKCVFAGESLSSRYREQLKEARNSFFGLGVYLLKSKFRIEDKLRFP